MATEGGVGEGSSGQGHLCGPPRKKRTGPPRGRQRIFQAEGPISVAYGHFPLREHDHCEHPCVFKVATVSWVTFFSGNGAPITVRAQGHRIRLQPLQSGSLAAAETTHLATGHILATLSILDGLFRKGPPNE